MDLLAYILAGLAVLAAIAVKFGGLGLVAGALTSLRDSRFAQATGLAAIGILTLFLVRRDGKQAGQAEAIREVEKANRQAVEKRGRIDESMARKPSDSVRAELKGWSE